ncbi:MAG: hypothetical protein II399_09530, partial [Lachnospiraceae bacterium]|nr:hypothetical protein [Lachnospiraceae bacterium]
EKYMNYLKRSSKYSDELYNISRKYNDVMQDSAPGIPVADSYIVDLLEIIFGLKADNYGYTTLSWWIYTTEFGKRKDMLESFELTYLPEDHKYRHPKLDTLRELYDFLLFEAGSGNGCDNE